MPDKLPQFWAGIWFIATVQHYNFSKVEYTNPIMYCTMACTKFNEDLLLQKTYLLWNLDVQLFKDVKCN